LRRVIDLRDRALRACAMAIIGCIGIWPGRT